MPGNEPNKPSFKFWHQGLIVSADNVVRFDTKATRDAVMAASRANGHDVEPTEIGYGFGFRERVIERYRRPSLNRALAAKTPARARRVGAGET